MTAELRADAQRPPFDADSYDFFEAAAPSPLFIDSPPAGRVYPGDFRAAVPERVLRGADDWEVDTLFADAPEAGASLLAARFPRAYIDPNRRLDDSVAMNHPNKGAEILRLSGRPAGHRHALQIEIKRALYMDEATVTATEGFAPLRANLKRLVAELVAWTGRSG